jgi:hypothetical protein
VNIKAEQLAGLSQTLFEYHDKPTFQLKTICALVYDLAADIHDWTEKKKIVMSLEEEQRNG